MKLNLGCGDHVTAGWVNVDYALGARLMKVPLFRSINRRARLFDMDWDERIFIHDLTKTFPWESSSIDVTYSSHTLEHLTREDGRQFLSECHRVLKAGGIVRIVVPDLQSYVERYCQGLLKADEFLESLDVLYTHNTSALKRRLAPFIQFPHKCMYDRQRLLEILQEIGFEASIRAPFESEIDDIGAVEQRGRAEGAVIIEGRKRLGAN